MTNFNSNYVVADTLGITHGKGLMYFNEVPGIWHVASKYSLNESVYKIVLYLFHASVRESSK